MAVQRAFLDSGGAPGLQCKIYIYHGRRLLVVLWVSSHRYYVDITVMGYDANGEYCNLYSYSNHELDYEEKSPNKTIPFPK